jgi:hypothetical protein
MENKEIQKFAIIIAVIIIAVMAVVIMVAVLDGENEDEERENNPPIADAGEDVTLEPTEQHTLDGSGSEDLDGDELEFYWDTNDEIDSDNDGVMDNDRDLVGETVEYTAPVPESTETITITLTVSDGTFNDTDTVDITVEVEEEIDPPEVVFTVSYGDPFGLVADPHYILTLSEVSRMETMDNFTYEIRDADDEMVLYGTLDELLLAGVNETVRYVDLETSIEGLDLVSEGDSVLVRDTAPVEQGMTFHLLYKGVESGRAVLLREIVP